MTFNTHEGYDQAARIDEILNEVLQAHEITDPANADGYLSFLRTVESGIAIARKAFDDPKQRQGYFAGVAEDLSKRLRN